MNTGTQIIFLLAVAGAAAAAHVVARPRAGRFMLVRIPDAERHRAATRRVLILNALIAVAAAAVILGAPDSTGTAQLVAGFTAVFGPPLWILVELHRALRGARAATVPSRFHVWIEQPPRFASYLSPPLHLLNVATMIAPALVLHVVWKTPPWPWLAFFLPLMIYLTALVLACAWMQARERWVLPPENQERYAALHQEKRTRTVRLLETGMLLWNLAGAMIWISAAAGSSGPGYLGAGIAVIVGGPGVVALLATQLPRLTRLADELAGLARAEALGTRANGWRLHGLIYCSSGDPAVFVPKRSGLGHTLNLARPAAWFFLAAVLLVPAAIMLLALNSAGP